MPLILHVPTDFRKPWRGRPTRKLRVRLLLTARNRVEPDAAQGNADGCLTRRADGHPCADDVDGGRRNGGSPPKNAIRVQKNISAIGHWSVRGCLSGRKVSDGKSDICEQI